MDLLTVISNNTHSCLFIKAVSCLLTFYIPPWKIWLLMSITCPLSGLILGKFCFKLGSPKLSPGFCLNSQGWRIYIFSLQAEFTKIKTSLITLLLKASVTCTNCFWFATRCGAATLSNKDRKWENKCYYRQMIITDQAGQLTCAGQLTQYRWGWISVFYHYFVFIKLKIVCWLVYVVNLPVVLKCFFFFFLKM